ncbi:Uncharacterised protein [Vibrio cholerae]|nr:Uncharacterised protein [Vibrio cholerae]
MMSGTKGFASRSRKRQGIKANSAAKAMPIQVPQCLGCRKRHSNCGLCRWRAMPLS